MFKVIINNRPTKLGSYDAQDETVSEAIETIYCNKEKEALLINWNNFLIELSFKYDVSEIYNDMVNMLRTLDLTDNGTFDVTWPSSSFFAKWSCSVSGGLLKIEANWVAITGGTESLIKLRKVSNLVTMRKKDFMYEWCKLLRIIEEDLLSVGYNFELPKIKNCNL